MDHHLQARGAVVASGALLCAALVVGCGDCSSSPAPAPTRSEQAGPLAGLTPGIAQLIEDALSEPAAA